MRPVDRTRAVVADLVRPGQPDGWDAGAGRPRRSLRRRISGALTALVRAPGVSVTFGQWLLRATVKALLIAAPVSFLVWAVAGAQGYQPAYPQLLAVGTAAILLPWLLSTAHAPPERPAPADPDVAELRAPGFPQADRWERRFALTAGDVEAFTKVARDRLAVVAGERLRQRHGVRLDRQPERAREILGHDLYGFLTGPLSRTPTPDELDRFVTRMKEI
ncbi:MAG: hypothetical protein FWJ70_06040 [Micromonosporaceae bacterium]|jgi:hypothetical protein